MVFPWFHGCGSLQNAEERHSPRSQKEIKLCYWGGDGGVVDVEQFAIVNSLEE